MITIHDPNIRDYTNLVLLFCKRNSQPMRLRRHIRPVVHQNVLQFFKYSSVMLTGIWLDKQIWILFASVQACSTILEKLNVDQN